MSEIIPCPECGQMIDPQDINPNGEHAWTCGWRPGLLPVGDLKEIEALRERVVALERRFLPPAAVKFSPRTRSQDNRPVKERPLDTGWSDTEVIP